MNELYEKSLHKLELDKVLCLLADQACSASGKEQCLKTQPLSDADEIRLLQKQTSAACRMITLKGSPGLAGVSDVGASVDRAVRGGCLSPEELLRVAGVLKCARQAKAYADGERRRVPVKFYAKVQTGEPVMAAVMDEEGHRAVLTGPVPEPAQRAPLTAQSLADQFAKTGGTPYYSTGTESRIDPDLYLPAAAVNDLRRRLITGLKEERAALPERRSLPLLPRPEGKRYFADPALIVQVHQAEQLTQELAALHPAYVYVPVEILDSDFPRLAPFLEQGAQVTAVLPRVITDDQAEDMHAMLSRAAENGVQEALVGNMGHIFFARRAGMRVRGDFGLNVFNSFTEEVLQQAGLVSATASFELRVAQIRDLAKSIDTEMIVYGRLPCMITEQCIIRNSAGRCNCSVPNNLADRRGALFPVLPAFGHRNQIFNAHKLYLADKHEDYETAGLWGVRLMFTTETPRECVAVTQSYLGLTDYRPNGLTRGLYYRGVE